ncbi:MAG: glycosyltransferase family 39 protein [Desulfobacterales bacterium]|nr:glycosyltransferase family 39 protein [Pseudomonadota bacterium]MCG2770791.1 glycosyltransferase family 39 protein [Desulfobacterales bacterium]
MKLPDESSKPAGLALWFGLLLGALILVGSFYNLANYPTIWWDEAIFSEAAANLVQHGRYAFTVQSPNQLVDFDFRISAGPAVILPVALAYKLFGVSLVSGRLVAGAYLVLTFLALFLGARRLWGPVTALLAVALAFLGTDVFYWGRSVLGDIPALGLFLCATCFLIRGLESRSLWPLFLGGIFVGLAFNAKEFYGLAGLPPLVVLAQQHWRDKRRLIGSVLAFVVGAALPPLAYLALKAVILGSLTGAIFHFLEQKKLLCHEFVTPLTIGRIYPESFLFLLQNPLFWLGCLGVGWIWRKETPSPGVKLWIWNFFLWSGVYLTAVYWHRFALPGLFLACPLAAYFIVKVATRLTAKVFAPPPRWLAPGIIAAVLVLFSPVGGLDYFKEVLVCQGSAPARLVQYLRTHVPTSCLIETPEYELAFLDDDHRIHHMPSYFFVESTPDRVVLLNPRKQPYEFNRVGADILILGSFGKSVFKQVYPPALINQEWRRVAQVEYYDIYVSKKSAKKC